MHFTYDATFNRKFNKQRSENLSISISEAKVNESLCDIVALF